MLQEWGVLYEKTGMCGFVMVSCGIVLTVRCVSDTSFRDSENITFCSTAFSENHGIYEIIWKNIVQPHRAQIVVQYSTRKA